MRRRWVTLAAYAAGLFGAAVLGAWATGQWGPGASAGQSAQGGPPDGVERPAAAVGGEPTRPSEVRPSGVVTGAPPDELVAGDPVATPDPVPSWGPSPPSMPGYGHLAGAPGAADGTDAVSAPPDSAASTSSPAEAALEDDLLPDDLRSSTVSGGAQDDDPYATDAAPATPTGTPAAGPSFSPAAANQALSGAAAAAAGCPRDGSSKKRVPVAVTFAPSGRVTTAIVTGGVWAGTPTGGCVARALRSATVPPFDGGPVTVTKTVHLQ